MNVDLKGALETAAYEGADRFAARDAEHVITPAARRVRRDRAVLAGVSVLGGVVVLAGSVWGLDGAMNRAAIAPAAPSTAPNSPVERVGEVPWSTLSLAAVTDVRRIGEKRIDSVAGMICRHDRPADDPRVSIVQDPNRDVSHHTTVEDCAPVWFKNGPATTDGAASVSSSGNPTTFSSRAVVTNTSSRPLAIDTDAIFMWVETTPGETTSEGPAAGSHVLVGPSMWQDGGGTIAVLDSGSEPLVVEPGESFVASAEASPSVAEDVFADLLFSGAEYTVTFWARIHEADPSGDATYLIQLGESHTYALVAE